MAIRIYIRYDFGNVIARVQKHLYEGKGWLKMDQAKTKGRQQKKEEEVNAWEGVS
jgi:hypothetical protein